MLTPVTRKQQMFSDLVFGTLLYSVVLGFFNDYTEVLTTKSYSTTFLAAFVLQLLTYATLQLKSSVKSWFSSRQGKKYKISLVFCVWLILFLSKFVFLAVVDFVFGDNVQISGFFGLMAMIICMMIADTLINFIYTKLGNSA